MAENNKIGKEQYLNHLDQMIFGTEMLFLSEPNMGTRGSVFTPYDKIIAGTFCEKLIFMAKNKRRFCYLDI